MEPKFQTSFIPKRPMGGGLGNLGSVSSVGGTIPRAPSARPGLSIFLTLAVLLFILSIAAVGGAYFWKQHLISTQAKLKTDLKAQEDKFELSQIEDLKAVNVQIDTAKSILAQHLSVTQIFTIISYLTIESVRFLSLDVTPPVNPGDDVRLELSGIGANLFSVAFQSKVLAQLENYGLRKIVKNPILSNPTLNPNNSVSFSFSASIAPDSISYEKLVTATSSSI